MPLPTAAAATRLVVPIDLARKCRVAHYFFGAISTHTGIWGEESIPVRVVGRRRHRVPPVPVPLPIRVPGTVRVP